MKTIEKSEFTTKELRTAVKNLKPQHQKILIARLQGKKLDKIAKTHRLTPARVFQIDKSAWAKVMQELSEN